MSRKLRTSYSRRVRTWLLGVNADPGPARARRRADLPLGRRVPPSGLVVPSRPGVLEDVQAEVAVGQRDQAVAS
jgi:hypothetical protein